MIVTRNVSESGLPPWNGQQYVLLYVRFKHVYAINSEWSVALEANKSNKQNQHTRFYLLFKVMASRKHAYIILTPLNPTFI